MKKTICLVLAMLMLLVACGAPKTEEEKAKALDEAVSEALLDYNKDKYAKGDCRGEGHVIMGTQVAEDGNITVYAFTMYGVYEEKDGAMCKIEGTGCLPMVLVFNDKYKVVEIKEPADSSDYYQSLTELFPQEYHARIFDLSIDDYTQLTSQESDYVVKWLEKKGKEMVIKQ